jgi:hypothetical protein
VADGVDAAVHSVKAPLLDAMADRATPEPEGEQLPARDDSVLATGKRRDLRVERTRSTLCPYVGLNVECMGHAPIVPKRSRQRTAPSAPTRCQIPAALTRASRVG